jgi:hypothetical protein
MVMFDAGEFKKHAQERFGDPAEALGVLPFQ